jgi:starch synthase
MAGFRDGLPGSNKGAPHGIRRVALFTNEYPPHVYGGAGVHVEHLSRALARRVDVEVRCFGSQDLNGNGLRVLGYPSWKDASLNTDRRFIPVLDAAGRGLEMARDRLEADVVHCHTWYSHLGGMLARRFWQVPLVVTVHSLEPLRPWKREQLGAGYEVSEWFERLALESADAVVAVSRGTRADILRLFAVPEERVHVIPNGVDVSIYRKVQETDALLRFGVDPMRPYVLYVGRISRQKGILHWLRMVELLDPEVQGVLCAGAADTPDLHREVSERVRDVQERRQGVVWIDRMVAREDTVQLYSHAAAFCCPSVYEPFGIINLEAMACGAPVVASSVGGIPEVVVDGETGILVDPQIPAGGTEPSDPEAFARALAEAIHTLLADDSRAARFAAAARRRAEEHFSWDSVAERTLTLYGAL